MRGLFGIVGLLVVVLIVGLLAKKQLGAGAAPPASTAGGADVSVPAGTPQQQVQQYKQAIEGAMQKARPMPDEEK
jgi:hypothetical protein